jgi:Berberine and berberine like
VNAPQAARTRGGTSAARGRRPFAESDHGRAGSFARLLRNHGRWCERNGDPASPYASHWTLLELHRAQFGKLLVRGVSTAGATAEQQLDEHLAALVEDAGVPPPRRQVERMSWLEFALDPLPDLFAAPPGGVCVKVKDALLRKPLTERQIAVVYDYLTRTDHDAPGGMFGLATYGGRINTVPANATASVARDSILDVACSTGWLDPGDEAENLAWARAFYRDLFLDTGGVPAPGEACGGALVNHPDVDLDDPGLNTSGVPWHTIYYGESYPRLQRIKARWDPRDLFRHALSIRPG